MNAAETAFGQSRRRILADAAWVKSCGVCARSYGAAQWEALPLVASLPHASVQSHLSVPTAWTVELRRCRCGRELAARSR